jgi:hypothetical protein
MKEKVNWDAPILGPLDYIKTLCIMLRTKAFHLISNGTSAFAKSSLTPIKCLAEALQSND